MRTSFACLSSTCSRSKVAASERCKTTCSRWEPADSRWNHIPAGGGRTHQPCPPPWPSLGCLGRCSSGGPSCAVVRRACASPEAFGICELARKGWHPSTRCCSGGEADRHRRFKTLLFFLAPCSTRFSAFQVQNRGRRPPALRNSWAAELDASPARPLCGAHGGESAGSEHERGQTVTPRGGVRSRSAGCGRAVWRARAAHRAGERRP